jgi:chromosome segregation ATPase
MPEQDKLTQLRSEVNELRSNVEYNKLLVERLDRAIEKMSEVSSDISKLLAVHETRIENQDENIGVVHKRISELRDELGHTMERNYDSIVAEFRAIKDMFQKHEKRIAMLEKWKYGVVLSAGVIGFLLSKVNISTFFG